MLRIFSKASFFRKISIKIELVPILGILICVTTYAHKQLVLASLTTVAKSETKLARSVYNPVLGPASEANSVVRIESNCDTRNVDTIEARNEQSIAGSD